MGTVTLQPQGYGAVDVTTSGTRNVVVTVRIVTKGHAHWTLPPARVLRRLAAEHAASLGRVLTSDRREEFTNGGPIGEWRFLYTAVAADGSHVVRTHQPWMPGQGPRANYTEQVFPSAAEAHAWAAARRLQDTNHTYTVHPA